MTTVAPSELYSQDPYLQEQFCYNWTLRMPLEKMLVAADIIVGHDDPVAFLDQLADTDRNALHEAEKVITSLPPKTILDNYGTEMLVWAAANSCTDTVADGMRSCLEAHANFDVGLLEKAKLWEWQKEYNSKGKRVLGQYRQMEQVLGGGLERGGLHGILAEAARPGVHLSEKRLADYGLLPLRSEKAHFHPDGPAEGWYGEREPGIFHNIWLDAPTGFALTYKGKPNAVVGLARSAPNELMIYQLQGVQAKRVDPAKKYTDDYVVGNISARGLAPLDWQKVMVDATAQLAADAGLEYVGIQTGEKNKWAHTIVRGETKPHLSAEDAARAYDVLAARLGFTQYPDKNWHRPIAPSVYSPY